MRNGTKTVAVLGLWCLASAAWAANEPSTDCRLRGRRLEFHRYAFGPANGFVKEGTGHLIVQHPKDEAAENAPLLITLSRNVFADNRASVLAPDDFYQVMTDFDWTPAGSPDGEPRLRAVVAWALRHLPIDAERVYLAGFSPPAASAAIEYGLACGDLFAAVKAMGPDKLDALLPRLDAILTEGRTTPYLECYLPLGREKEKDRANIVALHEKMAGRAFASVWDTGRMNPYGGNPVHWMSLVATPLAKSLDFMTIRKNAPQPPFAKASTDADPRETDTGHHKSSLSPLRGEKELR